MFQLLAEDDAHERVSRDANQHEHAEQNHRWHKRSYAFLVQHKQHVGLVPGQFVVTTGDADVGPMVVGRSHATYLTFWIVTIGNLTLLAACYIHHRFKSGTLLFHELYGELSPRMQDLQSSICKDRNIILCLYQVNCYSVCTTQFIWSSFWRENL